MINYWLKYLGKPYLCPIFEPGPNLALSLTSSGPSQLSKPQEDNSGSQHTVHIARRSAMAKQALMERFFFCHPLMKLVDPLWSYNGYTQSGKSSVRKRPRGVVGWSQGWDVTKAVAGVAAENCKKREIQGEKGEEKWCRSRLRECGGKDKQWGQQTREWKTWGSSMHMT